MMKQAIDFLLEKTNVRLHAFMTTTKQFVSFNGYFLYYHVYGTGSKPLLAFHGFDRTGADWQSFAQYLGDTFTIYAFDIFYHGYSRIHKSITEPYIGNSEWCALIERFMRERSFSKISLIGFSLGGKLVLSLLEMMPGHIENAFVMAPDGLKTSFWSSFVSDSFIGKILFRRVVKNPNYLFRFSGFLKRIGLINEKLDTFIRNQLSDEEKRKRVLDIWILFRDMIPDKSRIRKHIGRYKINFHMFFGKYDAIIPLKAGEQFASRIKKPKLHVMDCGHYMGGMTYEICSIIKNSLQ